MFIIVSVHVAFAMSSELWSKILITWSAGSLRSYNNLLLKRTGIYILLPVVLFSRLTGKYVLFTSLNYSSRFGNLMSSKYWSSFVIQSSYTIQKIGNGQCELAWRHGQFGHCYITNLYFLGNLARVHEQQSRMVPCSVEEWQRLLEHLLYVSVAKSAPACSPYEQSNSKSVEPSATYLMKDCNGRALPVWSNFIPCIGRVGYSCWRRGGRMASANKIIDFVPFIFLMTWHNLCAFTLLEYTSTWSSKSWSIGHKSLMLMHKS